MGGASLPHHPDTAVLPRSTSNSCSRACMTAIITQVLDSMVAHDPSTLPLATVYKATENSHPAALKMMTSWRTIVNVAPPSLLAIDTKQGTGYFALDVSEGNNEVLSILRGRIKVVNQKITELELFINRSRGDHGFSYNSTQLVPNYATLMLPPADRKKDSRASLEALSEALFSSSKNLSVTISDTCQFTELGWKVVDTGVYGNGTTEPIGCSWPDDHPTDDSARVNLVIDEELGFIVTSGIIPGKVYPYNANVSAFIPNRMTAAQEAQDVWFAEMKTKATLPLLSPTNATGETLEVLQFYNGKLQAMQVNVYLSGPDMSTAWL
ncbi:hypothetical protein BO83DRAFT_428980 [Aspergillus eucalypticola CBS 122712]|uniref:Uncharacterized protein n=1 Tax=Aspergillus eucalypticola (strain CBS 122712 / IBT 29274) TaxID=1448314 RepID=A0A317V5J2_ASPEC|nr:uncharacterized protein BO83DRAFT_428980 [Aspergillus eucalypticola CBS 122712]PWY68869.1 hypothetical protein BO83DRAFT_428980 [Aspergillus eucalypticola CBS 122712]